MEWQLWFLLLILHLCSAHQVDDDPFPMHTAARKGNLNLVVHLLKGGADINQQRDGWLYTPLHDAAYYGRIGVVRHLLENGASKIIENYEGWTALDVTSFRECDVNSSNDICKEASWNYDETVNLFYAECVSSIMCRSDLSCVNQKCVNPCLGYCGANTNCRVGSHQPICTCKIGYLGVAETGCQRVEQPSCTSDSQCQRHQYCWVGDCINVCSKEACRENEICKVGVLGDFKSPSCKCPDGFFVDSDNVCKKSGCIKHSECENNKRCESGRCVDPCEMVKCGQGARCRVLHTRRPQCFCPALTQGDPLVRCQLTRVTGTTKIKESSPMCQIPSETDTNVTIIKCSTEDIFDVDERIQHSGQGSNCGSNNKVPVGTEVMVSCWQSPPIIARCTNSTFWDLCNANSCQTPFIKIVHLCKQEGANAEYCGYRPPFSHSSFDAYDTLQKWPWLVGIFVFERYVCTGTLISVRYVLTAAHCTAQSQSSSQPKDKLDVKLQHFVGDQIIRSRGQQQQSICKESVINKIINHPKFRNGPRPENDISLLRLQDDVTFSKNVMPACIAEQQPSQSESAVTFDRNEDEKKFHWRELLQTLDKRCQTSRGGNSCQLEIKSRQFCSTELLKGFSSSVIEKGSSGGPYLVNTGTEEQEQQSVVGVASYRVQNSCEDPYTVYTDVTAFSNWIKYCLDTPLDAVKDCHGYTGY